MSGEGEQDLRCGVCGEAVADAVLLSACFDCGVDYHLNPYSNRPGIDCGDAVIGETLGVHFYCNRCIAERNREALAVADGQRGRAEAMLRALHGDALPLPPQDAPDSAPAPRSRPNPRRPARPGDRPRRRFRRIDR